MDGEFLARLTLVTYTVVLTLLCVYGTHRLFLLWTFWRVRRTPPATGPGFANLPRVTVQLPMFNERYVAERIIEQSCQIDYPADKLQIQVLDDSTDETQEIARAAVARMQAAGHQVEYLHRTDRTGYKAGALAEAMKTATGEFVAIFDADFLPPRDILRKTVPYFADPQIGTVQTRWSHLNREQSLLTQAQAILLDGHFVIEHTARNRSGRYMSFNGTAGIWRRETIADAGGWEHDTLTEDLDLSYRAQLKGWRFVFLPDFTSPGELPPEMNAFKAQQHRWTKGGAQTCLKLLPAVLRSSGGWRVKLEAFFHLTSCLVYILMVMLTLLIGPALWARLSIDKPQTSWEIAFELLLFVVGFGSATLFYFISQRQIARSFFDAVKYLPAMMAVGVGIAFNNAIAALDGFFGKTGEFVRTPKFGEAAARRGDWRKRMHGFRSKRGWQVWAELAIAVYLCAWMIACFFSPFWVERVSAALPFLLVFIVGYFYIAIQTLYTQWVAGRAA